MKKTLLLASVACLISASANAQMLKDFKPYIGADYAYDKADLKGRASASKDNFNSGIINAGIELMDYVSLEAFYQQSGNRKTHLSEAEGGDMKYKFNAYGLDLYGYLPLGCEQKFSLLATAGAAVYDTKLKHAGEKITKSRVGYRVGGGAQYDLTDHISARVVGRYSYIGTRDLNHLAEVTAGLRYTF